MRSHSRFFITVNLLLLFAFTRTVAQNTATEVRYYGTGCFTVQRGNNVLLTDPFIDNPSITRVLFGKMRTDTVYVKQYMNPAAFRKVKMVVAAHAHYDHLMDMPFLARFIPDSTPIISNATAKHLLSYYKLRQPLIIVNETMGTAEKVGQWHYSVDSTMRTMAFKSWHSPQIAGINFGSRKYTTDLIAEPLLASDWQEGQTLAFMVDWLEDSVVAYRMFFVSSMTRNPFGMFPKKLLDEHGIDDLFIASNGTTDYASYPGPLVELCKPERIFIVHWENFFRRKNEPLKAIDEKALEALKTELRVRYAPETKIITPFPLNYY